MRGHTLVCWVLLFVSCADEAPDATGDGNLTAADLRAAPPRVSVDGRVVDVESNYLPRVVMCENPDASTQSLQAQAIAARTFLAYRTRGQRTPSIADGQSDQVYSCLRSRNGTFASAEVTRAVAATRGLVITHDDRLTSGNFVSGAHRDDACHRSDDPTNTERFVTLNSGRTGEQVRASTIGNPTNPDNRGCMGQHLANCLADVYGLTTLQILKYFYGADIVVRGGADGSVWHDPAGDAVAVDPGPLD